MHVETTRSAFPLVAHSRAHGSVQVLNGSAKLINLLGQQTPLPCGLAMGPVLTSPLAPKQRCGSSFPGRRQEGQHPRKKKTLLLLATACVLTKGNINYSVRYCLKQNKTKQTNKQTNPCHIPRRPFLRLSRLLGHSSEQRLFERLLSLGKTSHGMEGTLESLQQRPRKAGEQVAPAVGSQNRGLPDQGSLRKSTPMGLPAIAATSPDAKGN